ncbi:MAG TPA: bifunctional 4-hydroxy-2-oxoglutarate aldolase/2-dehydro-3-deoxy-phosphogluconate aldolase [Gemmatimonadales bacterium]|nr:bifunctional 4-hydroxy-2-oxoglutarate aldolase/2-dehydro-3-deoxy-phosphogluconate aldolase [Gemmatimonadales bacterium]
MRPPAEVIALLREIGIIPVIRADSAATAVRVAETLAEAGIPIAEVTLTVPDAWDALRELARRPGLLVGAGTVTESAQVPQAIEAGAQFIVSPGFEAEVVRRAKGARVAVLAGALTPTEVLQASRSGADLVKIFPAQSVGGAAYIRALRGPFPAVLLVPTGGVSLETVGDFIRAGAAAVGVGGELVLREALARGDYAAIGSLAARFLQAVKVARACS